MAFYESNYESKMVRLPGLPDIRVSGASREPCPVCGHPTGDCVGAGKAPESLIGSSPLETLKEIQTVYLDEDVVVEREIVPGKFTKIIKYRAGSQITVEEAKNLGLI